MASSGYRIPQAILPPYERQRTRAERRRRYVAFYIGLVLITAIYGFFVAALPMGFYTYMALPIALLALIAIWALPDRASIETRGLEWLFFAYWIGFIVWPNYLAISLPGLPWISVRRLTSVPLTLILLISLSTSSTFRAELARVCRDNKLITRLFIGFVVAQFVSIGFSASPVASLMIFLNNQLTWTTILFASIPVFQKPERFSLWVKVTCGMAVFTAIIGIIEWPYQHILWRDHIPGFLKIDDESVRRTLEGQFLIGTGKYRSTSTFSLSLMFAEYLAMASPFLIHLLLKASMARHRLFLAICYVILVFALFRSGSRLGMVGFAISHLMFFIVWAIRRRARLRRSLVAAAVIYGYPMLFATFAAAVLGIHRVRRIFLGGGEHEASTNARFDQWTMGWPKIFARPVFGYGPGRSGEVLGYVTPGGTLTVDSYYLTVILEHGFLGLLCLFGMVLAAMIQSMRIALLEGSEEAALVGCAGISLGVFMFIKLVLSQPDNHSMVFMLVGAIMVFTSQIKKRGKIGWGSADALQNRQA